MNLWPYYHSVVLSATFRPCSYWLKKSTTTFIHNLKNIQRAWCLFVIIQSHMCWLKVLTQHISCIIQYYSTPVHKTGDFTSVWRVELINWKTSEKLALWQCCSASEALNWVSSRPKPDVKLLNNVRKSAASINRLLYMILRKQWNRHELSKWHGCIAVVFLTPWPAGSGRL